MPPILYTAGYTGVSPDDLHKATIILEAVLVDIRYSPWSKNAEWHQTAMIERFEERYIHVKELGNINYNNPAEGIRLADVERGTMRVAKIVHHQSVILLCACRHHETCHRRNAATEMYERYGLDVIHLTADDIYRMVRPPVPQQKPLF